MIKSNIILELEYVFSEGILNEYGDNKYVYNFTNNNKFSVKSLKTNRVDHNGYYTIYDNNTIVFISNGGKKYTPMSYKLILLKDISNINELGEDINSNFELISLEKDVIINGNGNYKIYKKEKKKRKTRFKCICGYCEYCLIKNPTNDLSNNMNYRI